MGDETTRRWVVITAASVALAAGHLAWMIAYRNLDVVCGGGFNCFSLAGLRALGPMLIFEAMTFFVMVYVASLVWWAATSLFKAAVSRFGG